MWGRASTSATAQGATGPTVPNIGRARMGKPSPTPPIDQAAAREWSLGWWAGNAVGIVNGLALAVVLGWLR